jgi:osmotically inducible protein OsmC
MSQQQRSAHIRWSGSIAEGSGTISLSSGVLTDSTFTAATRFGDHPGTNPEELLAASLGGCFTMNLANLLTRAGHQVSGLQTEAHCLLVSEGQGLRISRISLRVRGEVPSLDQAAFQALADEAERTCPISGALKTEIRVEATLG